MSRVVYGRKFDINCTLRGEIESGKIYIYRKTGIYLHKTSF